MTRMIATMEDLYKYHYGDALGMLFKDSAMATSTTDVRNVIHGAKLFSEIVTEANAFGMLPKKPWDKSGYRTITVAGLATGGAISEGGAIPATTQPTVDAISMTVKEVATPFEMTDLMRLMQGKDDVVTWDEFREYEAQEHANLINRYLCKDVGTTASASETGFETLDNVCSSKAEEDDCADVDAADNDIYGIDRDAATYFDAYVSDGNDTDRTLTLSLIDTVLAGVIPYWKGGSMENKGILTGYDTLFRINQILQPQQRFLNTMKVRIGINGIQSVGMQDTGFIVKSYNYIPIVCSNNVLQDTLSRIYVLDFDWLWFAVAKPTIYSEMGNTQEEQQAIDKFVTEGVFATAGELACVKFHAQGKVRDLK